MYTRSLTSPGILAAVLGLLLFAGTGQIHAQQKDPNRLGFRLYKKGNYKKAFSFFRKAIRQTPKNPYAWLNHGRTTYVLNKGKEPEDLCDQVTNWTFTVLSSLSRAVELDRQTILDKLAQPDKNFDPFKKTAEYRKWLAAEQKLPSDDLSMAGFLAEHKEWWPYLNGFPPVSYEFRKNGQVIALSPANEKIFGKWKAISGKIEIKPSLGSVILMKLVKKKLFFDQGRKWYSKLMLEAESGGLSWTLGPRLGDCGQYNF
jgi:tetratricopeptide (TPR) repeat protein